MEIDKIIVPKFDFKDAGKLHSFLEDLKRATKEDILKRDKIIWLVNAVTIFTDTAPNDYTSWTDVDLSSYVTSETKAVVISISIKHSVIAWWLAVRRKGDIGTAISTFTQVINIPSTAVNIIIGCDSNQKIQLCTNDVNVDEIRMDLVGYIEQK